MNRHLSIAFLAGFLFPATPAPLSAAPEAPKAATAHVSYVTESTVYLDAGTAAGLRAGDRIEIRREGKVVAVLEARFLASSSAECSFLEKRDLPRAGDDAFVLSLGAPEPGTVSEGGEIEAPDDETPSKPEDGIGFRDLGLRGRVGIRYSALDDRSGIGEDYAQPSLNLRVQGERIAGTPYGLYADVRARTTYRHLADGSSPSSSRNRVYRLEASWSGARDRWRAAIGRQVSPDLAAVSVFDGFLFHYGTVGWSFGLFAGTQPDGADYGYSTDIQEAGVYTKYEQRRGLGSRWSVTSGFVGSYERSELNREYLFFRGAFNDRRTYAVLSQEADINRGWKADAGESGLSPTNTFGFVRREVWKALALETGFDNRRRVRLYRDKITPETEFDDSYRQGTWAGASQKFGRWSRVGVRARTNSGGVRSTTMDGRTVLPFLFSLELRERSTRFENGSSDGWLHSFTAGFPIGGRTRWEVTHGLRTETTADDASVTETLRWTSLDIDLTLARHWYLSVSVEENRGAGEHHRSIYSSTNYRF